MSNKIGIINYGMGNLRSVENSVKKLNFEVITIKNPEEINKSEAIELLISSLEEWAVEGGFEVILSIGRSKSLINKHKKLGYTVDDNPSYEIIKKI